MIDYSFIIPHHNTPLLLNRCLDSIPQQSNIQIIVVDDNSDEGKKPIINRSDVEIYYLDATQTKGAGHARNVGLGYAKGRWLLFADADDYYKNNFINVLDEYVDEDIDVLYFNFEHKDEQRNKILFDLPFQNDFLEYDASDVSKEKIKFHHNVPWTKMVRHAFLRAHGIIFEEVPNGNDILFSMLVGRYARLILVEKKMLYVYVRNEDSITNDKRQTTKSQICKITHRMKQNSLYDYLGHRNWKRPVLPLIARMLKASGFKLFFPLVKSIIPMYLSRKNWIELFNQE